MGLDELLARLDARAAEERAAVLAEARAEAERIRADAERECARRSDRHLSRVRETEERSASKALAEATMDARGRILDARRRVADRVRAALSRRIEGSAAESAYRRAVTEELDEAIERVGGADAVGIVIDVSEGLAPHLGDWTQEATASGIAVTPDPELTSGFVLTADEGRVVVDGTLESRLELGWRRLAAAVLQEAEP